MALPVISGVYRVAVDYREAGGATAVNVFHLEQLSGVEYAASAVASAVSTAWQANQHQVTATTAVAQAITVTPLDGQTASHRLAVAGAKWAGQAGGNPIPAQAGVLKLTTNKRGPRNRGRLFVPFVAEGISNAGLIDQTNVDLVVTGWTAFRNALLALTPPLDLVVASYTALTAESVTGISMARPAGTQRRRQSRLR